MTVVLRWLSWLKIDSQNYYLYEKGSRGVPDDVYVKLHEAGCDLNWLITGEAKSDTINSQSISQNNNFGTNSASIGAAKDCKECPLPEVVKKLTQQNEKLTDKLLEKL